MNYVLVKNIEVSVLQVSDYRKRMPARVADCYAEVFGLFEGGKLKALPFETLPLDNFKTGLKRIEQRQTAGRIVLLPRA
jgi:NADPH2:quinone reductase